MTQRDELRSARHAKGLSQARLAEAIGVPQSTIGRLESDEHEPTLRVALAIARALDATVEELFGESVGDPNNK
jgi:DNA-binding XRE family transcriptional regulator